MLEDKKENVSSTENVNENNTNVANNQNNNIENKPESAEVFNDEAKKEKKPKKEFKPNVLVAKVLVVVILLFTVFLGLLKLADFLEKPKTLFYSVVDTTYNDFIGMMNSLKSDNLYSAYSASSIGLDTEATFNFSELPSEYESYKDFLNSMVMTVNSKIDRSSNYMNNEFKFSLDNQEKLNATHTYTDYNNYLRVPLLFDKFIELGDSVNIDVFDAEKSVYVGDIIKRELLAMLTDDKFISSEEAIAIDGKTIDCKKSSYEFTGSEISNLIDNIFNSIKANENTLAYVASLYRVDSKELDQKQEELKARINISETATIVISSYTKTTTDETVRFEIDFQYMKDSGFEDAELIYNKDINYMGLEIKVGSEENIFELIGSLDSEFEIRCKDNTEVTSINVNKDLEKINLNVKVSDRNNENVLLNANADIEIEAKSNTTYQLKTNIDLENFDEIGNTVVSIDGTVLLNSGIKVTKSTVKNSVSIDELSSDEVKGILDTLAAIMKGNSGIIVPEPVPNPDIPGIAPITDPNQPQIPEPIVPDVSTPEVSEIPIDPNDEQ